MAMNRFKSILVPVDISEPETARPAVERAVDLAHASEGNIRLVYVRSILPVTYMEFIPPHFDEKQQTECEHKLAALAAGVPLPAVGYRASSGWALCTTRCLRRRTAWPPTSSWLARTGPRCRLISWAPMRRR